MQTTAGRLDKENINSRAKCPFFGLASKCYNQSSVSLGVNVHVHIQSICGFRTPESVWLYATKWSTKGRKGLVAGWRSRSIKKDRNRRQQQEWLFPPFRVTWPWRTQARNLHWRTACLKNGVFDEWRVWRTTCLPKDAFEWMTEKLNVRIN